MSNPRAVGCTKASAATVASSTEPLNRRCSHAGERLPVDQLTGSQRSRSAVDDLGGLGQGAGGAESLGELRKRRPDGVRVT